MKRSTLLVALLAVGVVGSACGKKDQDPQTIPVGSASAAATVAADTPTTTAADTAAPPPPVTPTVAKPSGASIDACCAGIAAIKKSGKDTIAKGKAASAALVCPGIAKKVKDGQTSRGDALVQIKSLLGGVSVPECS